MTRAKTAAALALALIIASGLGAINAGMAQTTTDEAKADGEAFAGLIASRAQEAATTTPDPSRIPGYDANPIESTYGDDPDSLTSRAASAVPAHTGYRVMRESMESRATFSPEDIEAVLAVTSALSAVAFLNCGSFATQAHKHFQVILRQEVEDDGSNLVAQLLDAADPRLYGLPYQNILYEVEHREGAFNLSGDATASLHPLVLEAIRVRTMDIIAGLTDPKVLLSA